MTQSIKTFYKETAAVRIEVGFLTAKARQMLKQTLLIDIARTFNAPSYSQSPPILTLPR